MPPYLGAHLTLVYASGFFEILGGVGVLVSRVLAMAGCGQILLLLAVFPANFHMAANPESFPDLPPVALYARLPFLALFVAWAYWSTRPEA